MGGVDAAAKGRDLAADELVRDEGLAERLAGGGVGVGVFSADAGEAEAGAGEPEALVVEV